ncbi:MAG: hypothetical protein LQ338_007147 [Usnochroma carphineum]|nr:MAG: hypothetical protein LQ338_007147 [Usnochroma carphineum]
MITEYCALCGVPAQLEHSIYDGRVDEQDVAWTFHLHRLKTSATSFTCHVFCWENLRQQYDAFFDAREIFDAALVTNILSKQGESETTDRLSPDWCNEYEEPQSHIGPQDAATAQGWMDFYGPGLEGEELEHLDFLAVDPARFPDSILDTVFDAYTETASPAPEENCIADGSNARLPEQNADGLSQIVGLRRLPLELLKDVLQLLPLESALALRCVSKYFASVSLDAGFWRSRFIYPHELSEFRSTSLGAGLWKSHDLEKLYRALTQPSKPSRHWLNWNRIVSNNRRLLQRMREEQNSSGADHISTLAQSEDDTSEVQSLEVPGFTAARRFAVRFDEQHPVTAISKIRLSFVRIDSRYLVSGICFLIGNNCLCLGYKHGDKHEIFNLSGPDAFEGFDVELDSCGFYSLNPIRVLQVESQFSSSKEEPDYDFDPTWLNARFAVSPTQDILGFDVATSSVCIKLNVGISTLTQAKGPSNYIATPPQVKS